MGIFHTLTEGGQILSHRFRMLKQVLKIASGVSLLIAIIFLFIKMLSLPTIYYQGAWYSAKTYLFLDRPGEISVDGKFWGHITRTHYSQIEVSVPIKKVYGFSKPYADLFLKELINSFNEAFFYSGVLFWLILLMFLVKGRLSKIKKHLSGKKVIHPFWLRWKLKMERKASPIQIGPIPLVKNTETQHIMITGGSGKGKTNCLHHLLKQLREQGHQVIIIDTNGAFVDRYYDSAKDTLFNPTDHRTADWTPWAEGETPSDYASLAEAFIPQSYETEDYWRVACRAVFGSILKKTSDVKRTSEVTKWLLYESFSTLSRFVQGTKAASHLDPNSDRQALSLRSICSTFLECLESLKDTSTPFSIKEWIKQPTKGSWLFLNCLPAQRSLLLPLMSAWISCAIRALITLPPDLNRRIWFIIDELPSLQKIKDLELLLAEGRKYGGCCVLSLQSPAQLESIYGKQVAQTIIGNTATKIVFAELDPEMAAGISKAFGEKETQEFREGISYGAHESRDSVNLSTQVNRTPAISSTQIHSLKTNQALIKLPGDYPISKVKLKIVKR